ncbi:MAG: 30S ribosomal protein S19, partial [Nanoarchaeota archaeon]
MVKQFSYRGKTIEELKKLDLNEFIKIIPSRPRRSLKKGFTEQQKKLLLKIDKQIKGEYKK